MRWVAWATAAWAAVAGLAARPFIQASSTAKQPGEIITVRFQDPDGAKPRTLTGLSQEAGFYFWEAGREWVALIAVPWGVKPGSKRLTLTFDGPMGSEKVPMQVRVIARPEQARIKIKLPRAKAQKAWVGLAQEKDMLANLLNTEVGPPLWRGAFVRPLQGPISSPFGQLRLYMPGKRRGEHKGEDLAAPLGTVVLAANDGVVRLAQEGLAGHGGSVMLDHGYGLRSLYFHLSQVSVQLGQSVKKGSPLGLVGSEGLSTGAHVHWQLNLGPHPLDPEAWLEKPARMGL